VLPLLLLLAHDAAVVPLASKPPIVTAQGGPWAVVALHAKLAEGELTPLERRSLDALANALADGAVAGRARPISADASDAGGKVRTRVDADHLVVAWSAPAERLDVLLRAVDDTVRNRAKLLPAATAHERWPAADPAVDPAALSLAAPGHPLAAPTSGSTLDAAGLRALADKILKKDRIAIAVIGQAAPSDLLAQAQRALTAPLPAAGAASSVALALVDGTRLEERTDADVAGASSTVFVVSAGRGTAGADPKDRAARSVLARLAGGTSEGCDAVFAVAFPVTADRASRIARAEAVPMQSIAAVATTAPPAEVVETARNQERAARLERMKDADALADVLGRALLAGDASLANQELDALASVTPDDVQRAALALTSGPKVVVRVLGGRK
jgi:hypothetical protein